MYRYSSFLVVGLFLLLSSCEFLQSKKDFIQKKWQIEHAEIPGGEIAANFLKDLVPGASLLDKIGAFDIAKDFVLKEAQDKLLKANFDFQKDGTLKFSVAEHSIDAAKWRYESNKNQLILVVKGVELPLSIEKIEKEQMLLVYEFKGQRMRLQFKPML
ncbi:MAG: hypothetical protein SFU27_03215 [Thermonemataceae bacterium]|nr:hypothetical protein [Thermonemataceae bacterium]